MESFLEGRTLTEVAGWLRLILLVIAGTGLPDVGQ